MSECSLEKRALRRELLSRRLGTPRQEVAEKSAQIVTRLLALWGGQQRVALFWPMPSRGEVDLRDLDRALRARQVDLYYPRLSGPGSMQFRLLSQPEDLVPHAVGFLEPPEAAPVEQGLDWMIVPAMAATRRGHRLGYGGGYYDRALSALDPGTETVVVVFAAELLETLPVEPHDRPVRWVVTEHETLGPLARTGGVVEQRRR